MTNLKIVLNAHKAEFVEIKNIVTIEVKLIVAKHTDGFSRYRKKNTNFDRTSHAENEKTFGLDIATEDLIV
jgi:hypothetical protein